MSRNIKKFFRLVCTVCFFCLFVGYSYGSDTSPRLPESSAFLNQVDTGDHSHATFSDAPQVLRWNFSEKRVYEYNFSQIVFVKSQIGKFFKGQDDQAINQAIEGSGRIFLKSEGNGTARFVIEDIRLRSQVKAKGNNEEKVMETQMPAVIIQGVGEDGKMKTGESSQQLLLKTLFPLPPGELKIGDTVRVPAEMPFNVSGSVLYVKGYNNITLVDYVEIEGETCAKLQTDIDISEIDLPEEMEGDYLCRAKGRSIFFFEIRKRHFISGKVALVISIRVEAPTPKIDLPDKSAEKPELPESIKMSMDSDNFITIFNVK